MVELRAAAGCRVFSTPYSVLRTHFLTYSSGSLTCSGCSLASLTNSSTHGGQQNEYVLPPTIQVQRGLALVSVIGQIWSPAFGSASWAARKFLNFCDAVWLPFALMSASVYLPPGVR